MLHHVYVKCGQEKPLKRKEQTKYFTLCVTVKMLPVIPK